MELTSKTVNLAEPDSTATITEDEDVSTTEFEFTADLAIELPVEVEPRQFFEFLVRAMIAHTEAYGGFLGGETRWCG